MDLKNGYKKVYETTEGMFATKNNTCDPSVDSELVEGMINKMLPSGTFVYEKNGKIYMASNGSLPSFDENGESLDQDTKLLDIVTIEQENEPAPTPITPEDEPSGNPEDDDNGENSSGEDENE